jgi:hypothetical protein
MPNLAKTTTIIELHVPDFNPIKEFHGDLGFEVLWEYPAEGTSGYLMMQFEDNMVGFYCGTDEVYKHKHFSKFTKDTPRGYGVEIGFFVTTPIEEYYANVRSKYKDNIVEELKSQPWGQKDFRITDPFGFYLRFSEPSDMSKP